MTTSATPKLPLQNVCTSQPQVVRPVNPLWGRGLVLLYTPSTSVNHVDGVPMPTPLAIGKVGSNVGLANLPGSYNIPTNISSLAGGNDTILVFWKPTNSATAVGSAITSNLGVSAWVSMTGTAPNRTISANVFCHGNADVRGSIAVSGLDGVFTTVAWAGVGTTTCQCYINGIFRETLSTTIASSVDKYGVGWSPTNGPAVANANIALVAIWKNRRLSANEVLQLNNNPWQLFATSTPLSNVTSTVQSVQPIGSQYEIDYSNPITLGLKFASNAASDIETTKKSGKQLAATVVTAPDSITFPVGSAQDTRFPSYCGDYSDELTMVVVGKTGALQNNTGGALYVNVGNNTTGGTCSGIVQASYAGGAGVSSYIYYYPAYNGSTDAYSASAIAANQNYIIVGAYKRNSENTLYVNGSQVASVVPGDFAANLYFNGQMVYVGSGDIRSMGVKLALVFTRKLSAAEIASISSNPWQVFKALPSVTSHEVVTPRKSYMLSGRPPASSTAAIVGMGASNNTRFSPPNPQDAKINVANPLTKNIISAYLPFGKLVLDIACNSKVTTNGGFTMAESATSVPTAYGLGISFGGGSYRRESKFAESTIGTEPDLTVLSMFVPLSTATSCVLCDVIGNASEIPSYIELITGGFVKCTQGQDTANAITHQNTVLFDKANIVIHRNKHKVGNALQKVTLNGVPSSITATSSAQSGYGANALNIGGSSTPANSTKFLLNVVWNRILSDDEVTSISNNPWQIFAPDNQPVFGRAI